MRRHRALFAIALSLATAQQARAQPTAPRLRATEDLRIQGAKQNYGGDLFGFLLVTPTGRMAIADLYDFKIHLFEPNGKPLAQVGAKGAGPGEFDVVNGPQGQRAQIAGGVVGDTLWILDGVTRRVSYFTSGGKFLRTVVPPALMPSEPNAQPTDAPALIAFYSRAIRADGSMLGWGSMGVTEMVKRPDGTSAPQSRTTRSDMVLMAKDGKSHRSLAERPQDQVTVSYTGRGGRPQTFPVPFVPRQLEAMAPDGNSFAFLTQSSAGAKGAFTLTVISAKGDTLVRRSYPFTGIPITAAAADSYYVELRHDLTVSNVPRMPPIMDERAADDLEHKLRAAMPSVKSPITSFSIGLDNTIWIGLVSRPEGRPWLVLDAKGSPIGEVVLKGGFMVQANRTNLWQLEERGDETDIVRYRIDRGPP